MTERRTSQNEKNVRNMHRPVFIKWLEAYREISAFEAAYHMFFEGSNPLYNDYQQEIMRFNPAITNLAQAKEVTGPAACAGLQKPNQTDSYFRHWYTIFKRIGMITGWNVQYDDEFLVDTKQTNVKSWLLRRLSASREPGYDTFQDPRATRAGYYVWHGSGPQTLLGAVHRSVTENAWSGEDAVHLRTSDMLAFLAAEATALGDTTSDQWSSLETHNNGHFNASTTPGQLKKLMVLMTKLWLGMVEDQGYPGGLTSGRLEDPGSSTSQGWRPNNRMQFVIDYLPTFENGSPTLADFYDLNPIAGWTGGAMTEWYYGYCFHRGFGPGFGKVECPGRPRGGGEVQWRSDWVSRQIREECTGANLLYQIDQLLRGPNGDGGLIEVLAPWSAASTNAENISRNRYISDILAFFGVTDKGTDTRQGPIAADVDDLAETELSQQKNKAKQLLPIDFQCHLLENIDKLSKFHADTGTEYAHTIKINTDGQPGLAISTLYYGQDKAATNAFLNICPEVHGALVPYIRISRVEYDDKGFPTGVELPLNIPNFLDRKDIKNITEGKVGRAPGAGIKSFSWSLDGVQPAEVDNNITADLVLYFQTVNDFFGSSKQAGERNPNYLDLLINSPMGATTQQAQSPRRTNTDRCSLDKEKHRKYDGARYRIKVCAGWSVPEGLETIFKTMPSGKAKALERAIDRSKVSLFLQQVRHNLNFKEDASLELSIKYQAAISGIATATTADIFSKASKTYLDQVEVLEKGIDEVELAAAEDEEELTDSENNKIKKDLEKIKELHEREKLRKYKKLLKGLYEADKVYNLAVNPNEFLLVPYSDLTPRQRAQRAKRRQATETLIVGASGLKFELLDALGKSTTPSKGGDEYSKIAQKRFKRYTQEQSDVVYISYIYLGDLLDNILQQIEKNNDGEALSLKFFLSEVEMINPLKALQVKNLEDAIACGEVQQLSFARALRELDPVTFNEQSGISKLISIGDIPISLDAFQVWFKNKVIKKEKDKYFFLHFVKDVCAELITKALKTKCYGEHLSFDQRFDAQPLILAGRADTGTAALERSGPGDSGVPIRDLSEAVAALKCTTDASNTTPGLILISTDSKPRDMRGEETRDDDIKKGVFHHYIGSACGLVKKVTFNREDQPYLRESKIQKHGALGPEQLRELYSAQIDLVGNNLYRNGNYIYISPLLLSADQKQMDLLGLHGYYLVTSVKSKVTERGFDTTITALHEGIEFKQKQLSPELFDGLRAEAGPPWQGPRRWRGRDTPPPPGVGGTPASTDPSPGRLPDGQHCSSDTSSPIYHEDCPAVIARSGPAGPCDHHHDRGDYNDCLESQWQQERDKLRDKVSDCMDQGMVQPGSQHPCYQGSTVRDLQRRKCRAYVIDQGPYTREMIERCKDVLNDVSDPFGPGYGEPGFEDPLGARGGSTESPGPLPDVIIINADGNERVIFRDDDNDGVYDVPTGVSQTMGPDGLWHDDLE